MINRLLSKPSVVEFPKMSIIDPSLIECAFATKDSLYQAYMPFLYGGGLFVKTNKYYDLGELIILTVTLPHDPVLYKIMGKIAWITPIGAQANKPAGVGVQFIDDINSLFCNKLEICNKIEKILGDLLKSAQLTDTM